MTNTSRETDCGRSSLLNWYMKKLTMHGVTKDITVPGKIVVKGNSVTLKANFKIKCSDYQIKIPAASAASVSDDIDITVDCPLAK